MYSSHYMKKLHVCMFILNKLIDEWHIIDETNFNRDLGVDFLVTL